MSKIDILLATYNGELFLKEQLNSILNQSYKDFTLIIRDDGSTDKTVEIVNNYISQYPDKIIILHDKVLHRGAALSFGYLIEQSSADYIMLSDQDDVWLNNKVEITLDAMLEFEKEHIGKPLMVFTDLKEVDNNLKIINESFISSQKLFPEVIANPTKILSLNVVAGCTMMLNSISKQYVLPVPTSKVGHDQWIAANIAHYGKIKYLPVSTILYRQHNFNAVGANNIGIKYFVNKLLNPSKQLRIYTDLISNLNFKVNYLSFLCYKMYFTFKRLRFK
jgi:glycosyltransferase involved in cell wall biosynthesis